MNGYKAISWTQTEVDGLEASPLELLAVGSAWCWRGRAFQLTAVPGETVQSGIVSDAVADLTRWIQEVAGQATLGRDRIELSNGAQTFVARIATVLGETSPVLVFENGCPEACQDYWISAAPDQLEPASISRVEDSKVVVFPATNRTIRDAVSGVSALAAE